MASESENEKKREAIADVLADFRQYISNTNIPPEVAETIVCYIDRIEAAWKHEREEAEADALSVGGVVEAARYKRVGNAAALRDALVKIYREVRSYCIDYGAGESHMSLIDRIVDDPPDYTSFRDSILEIDRIVEAAFSAPARNCDKFADAESARQAWLADAENWDEFGSPELELHEWLLAPAAERKGEVA